jgi:hypothetical protein
VAAARQDLARHVLQQQSTNYKCFWQQGATTEEVHSQTTSGGFPTSQPEETAAAKTAGLQLQHGIELACKCVATALLNWQLLDGILPKFLQRQTQQSSSMCAAAQKKASMRKCVAAALLKWQLAAGSMPGASHAIKAAADRACAT